MAYGRPDDVQDRRRDLDNDDDSPLCNCCCCVTITLLVVLLLAIGLALFFVLVLKPAKPQFDLQSGTIDSFHVDKQPNDPGVYLSMNIKLLFSASNPNRAAIQYSPTEFQCLYEGSILGVATVPAFEQPAHSHTQLTAVVVVQRLNVMQSFSTDLLTDATVHDRVHLNIEGPVNARVKALGISSPKVKVQVNCEIVIRPQEQDLQSKQCNVGQITLSD